MSATASCVSAQCEAACHWTKPIIRIYREKCWPKLSLKRTELISGLSPDVLDKYLDLFIPHLFLDKDMSVKKIKAAIDAAPTVEEVQANTVLQPRDDKGK